MTRKIWKSKMRRSPVISLVMTILLLMMGVFASLSARSSTQPLSPESMTFDQDNVRLRAPADAYEVGVEWINDFPGTVNDRSHWDESCDGLYYKLRNAGWTGAFRWTNWSAWEEDFKDESRGGREDSVADTADIVMLCTHGSGSWDSFWNKDLSSVYFGSTVDDHHLVPGDAYHAYGDLDMEWLAFDSCSVLGGGPSPYYNRGYWAATMNGLHLLLGFRNTMYVISTGDGSRWADYLLGRKFLWWWIRPPYKVATAWFEAVDDLQPGGVCARVLAEESYYFDDYLWGRGTVYADHVDGDYYYRDHCSCTPPPVQLDSEVLAQIDTLPVYEVVDRDVNEAYVLDIASSFGISGTNVYSDTGYYFMIDATGVETYTLEVDMITGGYKYRNLSDLWASPVETPTLPLEDEALRLGNEFFTGEGENLPGAAYRTGDTLMMTEEEIEVQKLNPSIGLFEEQEISRMPLHVSLSFGRVISAEVQVRTPSGLQKQQQTISFVGPGARTKMYLGDLGEMLGVQGGSRDIQTTGANVTIMDASKAWDLYLADPTVALAQIPWVADVISKTAETLSYYEQPHANGQNEMIPAWVFTANFYAAGELLAEDVFVYVPAASEYLPPEVSIDSPTAGAEFMARETISFSGSVVQYGQEPFTYEWYSNHDGLLGSGATINASLSTSIRNGEIVSHNITLQVTDINGQQGAVSIDLRIGDSVYLPLVLKH